MTQIIEVIYRCLLGLIKVPFILLLIMFSALLFIIYVLYEVGEEPRKT